MEIQGAIRKLKCEQEKNNTPSVDIAYAMAIEALEKQIPKKVEIKPWSPTYCPTCGQELSESQGDGFYKHYIHLGRCPNVECGQRLEW